MIVLDASAFLSFLLQEESDIVDHASIENMLLLQEDVLVPPIFHTEVLNALLMAFKRNRIDREQLKEYIDVIEAFSFQVDDSISVEDIAIIALDHSLTSYDASYVTLAKKYNAPIISLDKAIIRISDRIGLPKHV